MKSLQPPATAKAPILAAPHCAHAAANTWWEGVHGIAGLATQLGLPSVGQARLLGIKAVLCQEGLLSWTGVAGMHGAGRGLGLLQAVLHDGAGMVCNRLYASSAPDGCINECAMLLHGHVYLADSAQGCAPRSRVQALHVAVR